MRADPDELAYRDRVEAGRVLARRVRDALGTPADTVVLALPRGGVPVGAEVARALGVELDVFVVRKLGLPGHEEFAIGAIAAGGFEVLNAAAIAELGVGEKEIAAVAERESAELWRRERAYRGDRVPARIRGRQAIIVDDGLATGFTMRAAIAAVRRRGPRRLIAAVPVGSPDTCAEIAREVDAVICPLQPAPFRAVGLWYRDFAPTTDDDVRRCLAAAAGREADVHASR